MEVPAEVTTITSITPAAWLGATAVSDDEETTVKLVAYELPNITAETLLNPVPLTVIVVPAGPDVGVTPLTVGADCKYVK